MWRWLAGSKHQRNTFNSWWWLFSSANFCLCSLFALKSVGSWQCPVFTETLRRFGQHAVSPAPLTENGTPWCNSSESENSSELSQPLHVFLGAPALMDESALSGWRCSWNQTQALQRENQISSCTFLLHRKYLNKVKCNTLPLPMLITHLSGEPQGWVGIKSPLSKSSSCIFSSNERKLDSFKSRLWSQNSSWDIIQSWRWCSKTEWAPAPLPSSQQATGRGGSFQKTGLSPENPSQLPQLFVTSSCGTPCASVKGMKYSGCCKCRPLLS